MRRRSGSASAGFCSRARAFPTPASSGIDADGDGFTGNAPGNAVSSSYGDRPASLSRNSFRLPSHVTLDTSVAYDLKLVGAQRLEIRLDAFNLMNRKNISALNNIIGLDPAAIRRRASAP